MIRLHIIRTVIFALIGLAIGFFILSQSPKIYEGRTQLVLGSQTPNGRFYSTVLNQDVMDILQTGLASNPQTEAQILRGEGVFRNSLAKVAAAKGQPAMSSQFEDYYRMYDVQSSTDSSAALIKARAYSAQDAADLANTIAETYNELRQNNQRAAVARALEYLQDQIVKAKQDLEASEKKFKDAKVKVGAPDITAKVVRDVEYESQLRASLDSAKAELSGIDEQIRQTQAQMEERPKTEAGDMSEQKSQTLQQLENQLAELERNRTTLLVQYYPDAIPVKNIDGSIESVKKQIKTIKESAKFENTVRNNRPDTIRKSLEANLANLKIQKDGMLQRVSSLEATQRQHEQVINSLPQTNMELVDLARDVDISDANYKRLKVQSEDLKNRTESIAAAAQIVDTAVPDENPVLPRPPVIYVVSILCGAIFGILVSFAIEALRLRIYSSPPLQEITGLPVVGVVHDLPGPTARRLLTSLREPTPLVAESYRFLAFAGTSKKAEGPRTILLTGADGKAGCSTTAAQFATALAQSGSRVALVDCALDDPTITRVFGLEQKSGVSDILSQTQLPSSESTVGTETSTPNLRVIGAGTEGKNAIKVAPTQNINGMIGALASSCDFVVIDTMPCLSSSDAARLVPYVDEVYLVVSAKSANMRNVAAAIDVLTLASAASIKFVMTKGSRGEEAVMKQANFASARG